MSHFPYYNIICAVGSNGEFGFNNKLPWGLIKDDMQFFKSTTTAVNSSKQQNAIIMGRNTFKSLKQPLSGRYNVVISSTLAKESNKEEKNNQILPVIYSNLDDALINLRLLQQEGIINKIFIIGGINLIKEVLTTKRNYCEFIYLTTITPIDDNKLICDCSIPITEYISNLLCDVKSISAIETTNNLGHKFKVTFTQYTICNINHPELAYNNLALKILNKGKLSINRTNKKTYWLWGEMLHIPLSEYNFPLLTCRKIFWRGVIEELLFFLSGKTQSTLLSSKGVKVWNDNTRRNILDKLGLDKWNEGDLGDSYPLHWRHYGAIRSPNEQLELGQGGIDQIKNVIENIKLVKNDPSRGESRRLIVTSWNPNSLDKTALPSCHLLFQFMVDDDELHCMVYMRSSDVLLGLPWNIAFYALLTYMIGYLTNLKPGKLVMSLANVHIYENHVDQIKEVISRPPRQWPKLEIKGEYKSIDEFKVDSFILHEYNPHSVIKGDMAV